MSFLGTKALSLNLGNKPSSLRWQQVVEKWRRGTFQHNMTEILNTNSSPHPGHRGEEDTAPALSMLASFFAFQGHFWQSHKPDYISENTLSQKHKVWLMPALILSRIDVVSPFPQSLWICSAQNRYFYLDSLNINSVVPLPNPSHLPYTQV